MEKVWFKNYEPGVSHEIDLTRYDSLVQVAQQSFQKYQDKPAFSNMGLNMTYHELDQLSRDFAAFLQTTLGCKKGDRLVIMLPNVLQYPVIMFGAHRAGLIVVNVNPLYTAREVAHVLKDSGAKVVVVLENFAQTIEKVKDQEKDLNFTVMITKIGDLLGYKGILVNWVVRYIKKMVPSYYLPEALTFNAVLKKR